MLTDISNNRAQAWLKQRNMLLVSTLALLIILLFTVLALVTRDRELVLQPVLPRPLVITSDHVTNEYLELVSRDTALLILNRSPSGLEYWLDNVLKLVDPTAYGEIKQSLMKLVQEQKGSDVSQSFVLSKMTIDPKALTSVVEGDVKTFVGNTVVSSEHRQFLLGWRYQGLSLRLIRFGIVVPDQESAK